MFTPAQVAKVLTGKDNPSQGSIRDVTASLDKQRRIMTSIDFSEEMRGKVGEIDGERFTVDPCVQETYLLDASKTTIRTAQGSTATGYTFNSPPILYQHDRMTGQLTSYPQSLLKATGEAVSSTQTNITMRDYIIARISRMRNSRTTTSRNIVYDTVFERIGRGSVSPKQRRLNGGTILSPPFNSGERRFTGWNARTSEESSSTSRDGQRTSR